MVTTSLDPKNILSNKSIELRKTFARLVFYADQSNQGVKHKDILQQMELTESEWQHMMFTAMEISQLQDLDAEIFAANLDQKVFIGGTCLKKDEKILMRF